jgi:RNA polymerase sigma-70 factor (ECF subfamily)
MSAVTRSRGEAGSPSDATLVAAVAAGNRDAFDILYQRHVDVVWRRMRRIVGPHADCEDLVQQTFVGAYRAIPRFRGDSQFATLLYKIMVRVAYDHLRKRKRDAERTAQSVELDELVALAPGPDLTTQHREALARALRLLEKIKPKKRIAWVLRVVEGLSFEEIGQLVDATPAAAGQRVRYAQAELEALLAQEVVS